MGDPTSVRVPEPRSSERVIFLSHLHRGLGFLVHPFLRGLLYFYSLQLHQLAPNSLMHIAYFVTFCKAFLGIEPHFRLWLKLFCIKMQTNDAQPTECGAAMIRWIPGSIWPEL